MALSNLSSMAYEINLNFQNEMDSFSALHLNGKRNSHLSPLFNEPDSLIIEYHRKFAMSLSKRALLKMEQLHQCALSLAVPGCIQKRMSPQFSFTMSIGLKF
jgi:hypothetical protein